MKLIKPSFEILEQQPDYKGLMQHIERCGRTCYKSEDKITEDSAEKFVKMLVNRGHTAMVEHGTIYLTLNMTSRQEYFKYCANKYSEAISEGEAEKGTWVGYVTTNYRVLLQNDWLSDLQYLTEPTKHIRRVTVKFVCDRGVSHEFVRHRVFSFAQESTRYCNYSKDKFGNELTFIIPCWLDIPEGKAYWHDGINYRVGATEENPFGESVNPKAWFNKESNCVEVHDYIQALDNAEKAYFRLMSAWENRVTDRRYVTGFKGNPWTPQQARAVLPNSLKTELVMTGFVSDWKNFFKLRDAGSAHPQAQELAKPLHEEFIRRNYVNE